MTLYSRHWAALIAVLVFAFSILGFYGREVYRQAPPIPDFIDENSQLLFSSEDILTGQLVWQSAGGQQIGTVFGHGAYQAPDWTADWLHREILFWLEDYSQETFGLKYQQLTSLQQKQAQVELQHEYKNNSYTNKSSSVKLSSRRQKAMESTSQYYVKLWGNNSEFTNLRENYAMAENTIPDIERREKLTHFFFWTAWTASTLRPNTEITYTNNWPHEPLLYNVPSKGNLLWSVVSVMLLLIALAGFIWYWNFSKKKEESFEVSKQDPMNGFVITPSQKALGKYIIVVFLLFLIQCLLGALLAHYTVEGQAFFGIEISKLLPYSLARTWHLQLALFWIATSFLTAGLFLTPIINEGQDPKGQLIGVNILFGALIVVVGGSLAGEAFAIHQKIPLELSFWLGHQGYEYVDLGRIWQIALFVGLLLWLFLMLRGIAPVLKNKKRDNHLLWLFTGSVTAIGLFYAAGFFYGAKSNLSVMEYWRWWVVHLWVEGFFEVFATTALAFVFSRMGLISLQSATRASLASAAIFLIGGIPGTFHHLYFSGTPTSIMAVGACFSALEVVPLILIGFEAKENWHKIYASSWMLKYKWPVFFMLGVSFWNMVGAGIFGFLINPPISLYYVQGLNLTPVHAHTATFGVYGLLSLGLLLFVMRWLKPKNQWDEKSLKQSFWAMNIGLGLMVLISLLPVGLLQAYASVDQGLWWARSADFMQQPLIIALKWLRMPGDTLFLIGVFLFGKFIWRSFLKDSTK